MQWKDSVDGRWPYCHILNTPVSSAHAICRELVASISGEFVAVHRIFGPQHVASVLLTRCIDRPRKVGYLQRCKEELFLKANGMPSSAAKNTAPWNPKWCPKADRPTFDADASDKHLLVEHRKATIQFLESRLDQQWNHHWPGMRHSHSEVDTAGRVECNRIGLVSLLWTCRVSAMQNIDSRRDIQPSWQVFWDIGSIKIDNRPSSHVHQIATSPMASLQSNSRRGRLERCINQHGSIGDTYGFARLGRRRRQVGNHSRNAAEMPMAAIAFEHGRGGLPNHVKFYQSLRSNDSKVPTSIEPISKV